MQTAAALIVGDEILAAEIEDRNGPLLVRTFNAAGIRVVRTVTVPDDEDAIVAELQRLRALADGVFVSGGIGPTHDDVTRPAVARALGVALVSHPEAERRIRAFYAERVTDSELGMALMPAGARLLDGLETGTFGFGLAGVHVLPGVPFLFEDIVRRFTSELAPGAGRPLHRAELRTCRREGEIAPCLADVQGRSLEVAIGSYPVFEEGAWHVRVVVRSPDRDRLEQAVTELRGRLA